MDEFQKVDAAFSFADMVVMEERKILVFIRGIKLSEDQRYIMHQKPQTLDACYEAAIYLQQTKVLDEGCTGERTSMAGTLVTMRRGRRGG